MMKPEKIIAAFLQVWDKNPELFLSADVEADLDSLNQKITSSPDAPNSEIAKQIQEWCKNHPNIRDAVLAASRKPIPKSSQSAQSGNVLDNRFPTLSQILRERGQDAEKGNTP